MIPAIADYIQARPATFANSLTEVVASGLNNPRDRQADAAGLHREISQTSQDRES
jgi:hypothetical protein